MLISELLSRLAVHGELGEAQVQIPTNGILSQEHRDSTLQKQKDTSGLI